MSRVFDTLSERFWYSEKSGNRCIAQDFVSCEGEEEGSTALAARQSSGLTFCLSDNTLICIRQIAGRICPMTDKGLAYWPVHCIRNKENKKTEKTT